MHLSRQLMLAGPVLELGLPTLILLNMSDVMEARSGEVDSLALAQELGAPVAKISAARGTGLDAVRNFLARKNAEIQRPLQLPIMGNAASYRQWATGVSTRTKYKGAIIVGNDAKARSCAAASGVGSAALSGGRGDAIPGRIYVGSAAK